MVVYILFNHEGNSIPNQALTPDYQERVPTPRGYWCIREAVRYDFCWLLAVAR